MKDEAAARKIYEKYGSKYDTEIGKGPNVRRVRSKILTLLGSARGKKILDAGCGSGILCKQIADRDGRIFGIDISPRMIELAKKKCKKCEFKIGDFERTGFKAASFDAVVSINAIVYKKKLDGTLREFKRIIKRKGQIVLAVPHPMRKMLKYSHTKDYFDTGKHWEIWKGIRRFNYYWTIEDYVEAFRRNGLIIDRLIEPRSESKYPHFLIFQLRK